MKGKKGICLILCLLLLTGLAPLRAAAVCGEQVDGVWASIALTGGANKVLFSADGEIENQILYPGEQTASQYILPPGAVYDAASNTLNLTDFDEPTANLVLTMMGGDFKIRLAGSSRLASICSDSKGRGGSITFCGDGALDIVGSDTAILVRAGGAPDFVRIEPQPRITLSSSGSAIRVYDTALADGAIVFDTSDPQLTAYDAHREIGVVTTTEGDELEARTLPGSGSLYGQKDDIDFETEQIVSSVYLLGEKTADGLYPVIEEVEHGVTDTSAYLPAYTPHDWILVETNSGATASQARFARFTISVETPAEGGLLSVSQTEAARGGSVEVRAVPREGYKLVSLMVNGEPVSAANGVYVIGGITADQTVVAVFAAATPESIRLTPPENTSFLVPADGAEPFVSEPFAAAVTDGAGDPVGAAVRLSVSPETEGVSIDAEGRVTVTNAAKTAAEAAGEEALVCTVTAEVEGTEIPAAQESFRISLSERRAALVRLTRDGEALGESDSLTIPAAGETTRQRYGALVYDQYGALREETVDWSAGDWPVGVRRDDDTLTVSDNCRDGSTLVVTAKAASDNAVAASVTVSFVVPEEPPAAPDEPEEPDEPKTPDEPETPDEPKTPSAAQPGMPTVVTVQTEGPTDVVEKPEAPAAPAAQEEAPAAPTAQEEAPAAPTAQEEAPAAPAAQEGDPASEPTRNAPSISWPTITLAAEADRVYGITWGALVALGEDGSATLGGSALEGSFEINKDASARPNVSDSFKILFSYLDGEEIKTVESAEQTVALARKAIDASMVILSPDSMQYSYGEECRPAVSIRDGARALVPGTDFAVTGYAGNTAIGTGSVTVEGVGNYKDAVTKNFTITPIPASALTSSVTACRPEDEATTPAIVFKHGEVVLVEGKDYDLSLQYDIPAKTGTATAAFKGVYSGTRILSFDLPNYLITAGAGGSWSKSSSSALPFTANGALGKFTALTVDGKTVPKSYYSTESGSTIVKIKPDYLKGLAAGKHIVGIAYKDGKALAIFSVTDVDRRGVPTGDTNNATAWIILLAASLIAFGALTFAFVRSGKKKKKKKKRTK